MQKEDATQFMLTKIEELQSALFFPDTADRILPTCVLQQVQTDEEGCLLFQVPCPPYAFDPDNASFPCKMDFFRKGASFHMKVNGIASIVYGPKAEADKHLLTIKVQIKKSSYFEIPPAPSTRKTSNNVLDTVSNAFNRIAGQFFGKAFQREIGMQQA